MFKKLEKFLIILAAFLILCHPSFASEAHCKYEGPDVRENIELTDYVVYKEKKWLMSEILW